jgi:hypothetical protein
MLTKRSIVCISCEHGDLPGPTFPKRGPTPALRRGANGPGRPVIFSTQRVHSSNMRSHRALHPHRRQACPSHLLSLVDSLSRGEGSSQRQTCSLVPDFADKYVEIIGRSVNDGRFSKPPRKIVKARVEPVIHFIFPASAPLPLPLLFGHFRYHQVQSIAVNRSTTVGYEFSPVHECFAG